MNNLQVDCITPRKTNYDLNQLHKIPDYEVREILSLSNKFNHLLYNKEIIAAFRKSLIKTIIVLFIFISSSFAFDKTEWKKSKKIINTTLWKHKEKKNQYISYKQTAINPNDFDMNKYQSLINKKKSSSLSFLGIKNWKAKVNKIEKNVLKIEGSYLDTSKKITYFLERHVLKSNFIHKFLYSSPTKVTDNFSKKKFDSFINNEINK